jgi:hypothetical protein
MQNPHDTLFHHVMRHPAHAAAWVRSRLPATLELAIDWSTFAPAGERVPGLRLRSQHLDLVFVAELDGRRARLVLLLEHKSAPDVGLLSQVLRYCVHLLHSMRRASGRHCQVVPFVLSHGGPPVLAVPTGELDPEVACALAPMQPRIAPLVEDLDPRSEQELLQAPLPPAVRLLFLCLQQSRRLGAAEWLRAIDRWSVLLRAVESDPSDADPYDLLDAVGWYLVDTSDLDETQVQVAFERHLSHPENQRMTTGQRIRMESREIGRAEGRSEGRSEGRVEGRFEGRVEAKAETLIRLLQRRFGPLGQQRLDQIGAASVAQLDHWTDRVLDVSSCDDVFAGA